METTDLLALLGKDLLQTLGVAIAMLTFVGLFGLVVSRLASAWAKAKLEKYQVANPTAQINRDGLRYFGNAMAVATLVAVILVGGVPVFIDTIWQDGEINWPAAIISSFISVMVAGIGVFFLGLAISIFRASHLQDKVSLTDETTQRLGFDRETERL